MKYQTSDLVRIEKRENNKKRNYLVVNPLQGKHVPVSPEAALHLFDSLADEVRGKYDAEKLLVIGFAETATAIGARVAVSLETRYIQTTREVIPNVEYLFFSEEHSHATEQKLVKDDIDAVISDIERILFVEDEVTTGKTILNIISILEKKYPKCPKFAVASLLNGMNEESLEIYQEKNIDLFYLVKTNHSAYGDIANQFHTNGTYHIFSDKNKRGKNIEIQINGAVNTRRLTDSRQYERACEYLWEEIVRGMGELSNQKILVLGTEECMYPALYIGSQLEKNHNQVFSHSTTRSPIEVSLDSSYPLHSRYELRSVYDDERITFLYDIDAYDRVIIVTDAKDSDTLGTDTLIHALSMKNSDITLVRWCENGR